MQVWFRLPANSPTRLLFFDAGYICIWTSYMDTAMFTWFQVSSLSRVKADAIRAISTLPNLVSLTIQVRLVECFWLVEVACQYWSYSMQWLYYTL